MPKKDTVALQSRHDIPNEFLRIACFETISLNLLNKPSQMLNVLKGNARINFSSLNK